MDTRRDAKEVVANLPEEIEDEIMLVARRKGF
jgi:hypothetical protein